MKKILIACFIALNIHTFGCENKELHRNVEKIIKNNTAIKKVNNTIELKLEIAALLLMANGSTEQEIKETLYGIIAGLEIYCLEHDYKFEVVR